jgi:hypothetical protein
MILFCFFMPFTSFPLHFPLHILPFRISRQIHSPACTLTLNRMARHFSRFVLLLISSSAYHTRASFCDIRRQCPALSRALPATKKRERELPVPRPATAGFYFLFLSGKAGMMGQTGNQVKKYPPPVGISSTFRPSGTAPPGEVTVKTNLVTSRTLSVIFLSATIHLHSLMN